MIASDLLESVKKNLIIGFDNDDSILVESIDAAINYAEGFQNREDGYYIENLMPPATERAVIMLASYFYESRDGTGGTFFSGTIGSIGVGATNLWRSVNDMLRLNRDWMV